MSPTARSLAKLRADGYTAGVVEKWNAHAHIRQDFLGFADILAIRPPARGTLAIQACVTGDITKRLAKIAAEPRASAWLEAGNEIMVWGWAKRGPRGKRKTWTLTTRVVGLSQTPTHEAHHG